MKVYNNISELVGNTPMVRLNQIEKALGLEAKLYAKVEAFNPAGSAKDRVGLAMILDAEEKGLLKPGSAIIESTSGNTGVGIAAAAASRGYRVIITMPETMSIERQKLLKAFGAELVLTDGALGTKGAVDKAEELHKEIPGSIIAGQFDNPANPGAHYKTTGPEIYADMDGKVDYFVAGAGTGGTISGVGKYLKEQNSDIKVVAVEPATSPLISKGYAGPHGLQGIGANFIPKNLDTEIIDEVITVSDEDAYKFGNMIAKKEGFLVGITSGASLAAGIELAKRPENKDKNIVVFFTDTGERYLSTTMFD